MFALHPVLPRILLAALPLVVFGGTLLDRTLMTRHDHTPANRHFSAFATLNRAYCAPTDGRFVPNALRHDEYGNPYLFECNGRGFTIVSAGADGVYDTADDERSDR